MLEESSSNHNREDNIKREGDREVWKAEDFAGEPGKGVRVLVVPEEHKTHCCVNGVGSVLLSACYGIEYAPTEATYIKHGKAMTHLFLA